jgi:hypothetical protein
MESRRITCTSAWSDLRRLSTAADSPARTSSTTDRMSANTWRARCSFAGCSAPNERRIPCLASLPCQTGTALGPPCCGGTLRREPLAHDRAPCDNRIHEHRVPHDQGEHRHLTTPFDAIGRLAPSGPPTPASASFPGFLVSVPGSCHAHLRQADCHDFRSPERELRAPALRLRLAPSTLVSRRILPGGWPLPTRLSTKAPTRAFETKDPP